MLPGCQFSLALNTPQIHLLISWLDPPLFDLTVPALPTAACLLGQLLLYGDQYQTIILPGCQFSLALNTPQIHLLISWLDPPLFGFDGARSTYGRLLARLALIMWGSIP
ncbi:hypothetical protein CEXT_477181 [Caerostris extrusa]|uniref:Uncharacterized protein n=1 Tax=Caerostris extrusa TaxID=172846 RepID=A0AAV4SWZ1_CAEEX|nr:hypothetical protein CEXT_477181 [Caerostris extrusa]